MKYLKEIKKSVLVTNLIYIIVGITMMIIPGFISNFICYIIGILIILFSSSSIIKYNQLKQHNIITKIILVIGIMALIFGLVIVVNPKNFASIVPIVIGIYIMTIGISKYNQAMEFKRVNYKHWYSVLLSAVLLLLLGIVIIFNPFETLTLVIRLVGIIFIINSLYDIYNIYSYQKNFKDLKKDFFDILK